MWANLRWKRGVAVLFLLFSFPFFQPSVIAFPIVQDSYMDLQSELLVRLRSDVVMNVACVVWMDPCAMASNVTSISRGERVMLAPEEEIPLLVKDSFVFLCRTCSFFRNGSSDQ